MVGADVAAASGGGLIKWLLVLSGVALISIAGYGIFGPEVDTTAAILFVVRIRRILNSRRTLFIRVQIIICYLQKSVRFFKIYFSVRFMTTPAIDFRMITFMFHPRF